MAGPGKIWTEEEVTRLLTLYETENMRQVAEALGRSYMSVKAKLNALHVSKGRPPRIRVPWTGREEKRLDAMIGKFTIRQMAAALGRTESAVSSHLKDRVKAAKCDASSLQPEEPDADTVEKIRQIKQYGWLRRLAASFADICTTDECKEVYGALAAAWEWGKER